MIKEKGIQSKILNDLRSLGKYCEAFKIIRTSDNAIPDVFFTTVLTGGVFIETKRLGSAVNKKGVVSKLQRKKIESINTCGCMAFTCYCWDEWYDIKKTLGLFDLGEIKAAHEAREKLLS